MPLSEAVLSAARIAAAKIDADVFLYNGTIERGRDLQCIEAVFEHQKERKRALLLPVTNGGSPDAAYKITRYFQERYDHLTVLVSGICKSAGTLMAVGADELAFTPFGELGPLDIQLSKVDRFDSLQSGLTIQEALDTLESRACQTFYHIVQDYIRANNGLVSFATAAKAASDFVAQLYGPVFSRVDPEEVGARSRSMRIAIEYGKRLAIRSQNLKHNTLSQLAEKYSSHSFVIDQREATGLFQRVREANPPEKELVTVLGQYARFELPRGTELVFQPLSVQSGVRDNVDDRKDHPRRGAPANGSHPRRTDGKAKPPSGRIRPLAERRANGKAAAGSD